MQQGNVANFLESLMLHKGSAASATGYYLCTVHGVTEVYTAVCSQLSWDVRGMVHTYLQATGHRACTLN